MSCIANITYNDTALPTDSDTKTLFNSITAFAGGRLLPMAGVKRWNATIVHSHAGTVKGYFSTDKGTVWEQFYDSGSIAAPAAADATELDIPVIGKDDVKFEWVNGGTRQTTFFVSQAFPDEVSRVS